MNKVPIHTISLGCPKNLVDTESMLGALGTAFTPVAEPEEARVVLINTCGFIRPAVEESVQAILDAADAVSGLEPKPLLVVTGCLVARYEKELRAELTEVDVWLPMAEQSKWLEVLSRHLDWRTQEGAGGRILTTSPGTAYLKIAEGCDHRCRFCIIPNLRGPLTSRSTGDLVNEARSLLDKGVKELILVAQDVTSYGRDHGRKHGLEHLLDQLLPLDGLKWLRLLYLYPAGLTSELLTYLKGCGPAFLPYFDVPLQHAHPDILSRMGRPFARDPKKVIERIRTHLPHAALRTSLIVGYPGETEEHFQTLKDFVREVRFHNLGVFTYFPEEGTEAASLPNQVEDALKEQRRDEIMEIQAQISAEYMESQVDTVQRVLVERVDPEWPTLYRGRVWFQAPEVDGITYVSGEDIHPGMMVEARIDNARTYDLSAVIEDEQFR